MFYKKFNLAIGLTVYACVSAIGISSAKPLASDYIILITGDTVKGQIKQMSDEGTITIVPEKVSFERLIDTRFINLARLASGSVVYRRKNQVLEYSTIEGRCAVFPFSKEIEASIALIFPDLVKQSIQTNYNNNLNRTQPELFELTVSEIPIEYKKVKKVFDAYAYANAAIICLVEPSDGSRVTWHFYAKPIYEGQIKSMITSAKFDLIEEYSFRVRDTEVSDLKIPFTMSFDSSDSCTFVQNGKKRILKYRVIAPSSIGFTTYGKKNDLETIYKIVYVSGPVMRYSTFFFNNEGFVTRAVRRELR